MRVGAGSREPSSGKAGRSQAIENEFDSGIDLLFTHRIIGEPRHVVLARLPYPLVLCASSFCGGPDVLSSRDGWTCPASRAGTELEEVRRLYQAGDYDACAQAAAAQLAEGYSGEEWVLLKVESDRQRGRYADALATLDAVLNEFPMSVRLRWTGYPVLLFNQQPKRAQETLEEIADLASRSAYRYNDSANRVTLGRYYLHRGADARRVLETFYDPVKKDQPEQVDAYLAAGELR